jgi:hypothetical protein
MKKRTIHYAVAAAFVAASMASNVAYAVVEMEGTTGNNSIGTAQPLTISDGRVEVTGSIGAVTTSVAVTSDIDFYSFQGSAGDMVTVDINGGMKEFGSTSRSVDTILGLFAPDGTLMYMNDEAPDVDVGDIADARIVNAVLPADGTYVVGVSSFGRFFVDQGGLTTTAVNPMLGNGSYTLTISGVTTPVLVQPINIDIRPRHEGVARIYPHVPGRIPVALLSSDKFDALTVDRTSVTFGASGDEASLVRCHDDGVDVNRDGRKDLVCRFDSKTAGFDVGDLEGVVKGTAGGKKFEGHAQLKVIVYGKKRKHGDRDRDDRRHGDRDHDRGHGNRGHGGRDRDD